MSLTLGSLFDGSGGFPLGGLLSGITPIWASEIEPFPIRVTTKRLPFMKHYGDVSQMHGSEIEPVDIITFGSPCQDMSIAGKRAGLDGSRSNLFYESIRIVKEMRCATGGAKPRYIVWENVPGAFSSNKGQDFRSVLEAVCSVKDEMPIIPEPPKGKWEYAGNIVGDDYSVAWRVLDAQFWGVPQRRRRIFLVADFAGWSAEQILFESESLSGYSPKSFCPWKRTSGCFETSTDVSSVQYGWRLNNEIESNEEDFSELEKIPFCKSTRAHFKGDSPTYKLAEIANTLNTFDIGECRCNEIIVEIKDSPTDNTNEDQNDLLFEAAGFCTEHSSKSRSIGYESGKSPTLRAGVVPGVVYENHSQDSRYTGPLKVAPTVSATYGMGGNNQPFVVSDFETYGICSLSSNSMKSSNPNSGFYRTNISKTLDLNGGNPSCNQGGTVVVCKDKGKEHSYSIQGSMIGRKKENGPQGSGINEDVSFTLNATDRHAVYSMTTGCYSQVEKELSPTLMARDYKDPQ